jgi:hypothetical protein
MGKWGFFAVGIGFGYLVWPMLYGQFFGVRKAA